MMFERLFNLERYELSTQRRIEIYMIGYAWYTSQSLRPSFQPFKIPPAPFSVDLYIVLGSHTCRTNIGRNIETCVACSTKDTVQMLVMTVVVQIFARISLNIKLQSHLSEYTMKYLFTVTNAFLAITSFTFTSAGTQYGPCARDFPNNCPSRSACESNNESCLCVSDPVLKERVARCSST